MEPVGQSGTEKKSVSLPTSVVAAVRERSGPGEFSSYVARALIRQLQRDALDDIAAEMADEHGPVDEAEVAALAESLRIPL